MGKGEIACYEQFLLFPQCFQKACCPGASKGVIVWEWVKVEIIGGIFYTVGKGEIVFKGLLLQTCKNQGLFGKGLIHV